MLRFVEAIQKERCDFVFYDRFVALCKKRGMSPAAAAREIGLSNSSTTSWKHGATPKTETLKKISQYFGVTVGYLLDGHKRIGDYCKEWKSNKAARLYMCIDSTLLDDLEWFAKEDNMLLEDKIEEILYWDVENRLDKMADEESQREMQEWYDSRSRAETAPQPPPAPQEGTDTTPPPEGSEGPPNGE